VDQWLIFAMFIIGNLTLLICVMGISHDKTERVKLVVEQTKIRAEYMMRARD